MNKRNRLAFICTIAAVLHLVYDECLGGIG